MNTQARAMPLASSAVRILRTKTFVPRAHPDLVPRGRLVQLLETIQRRRLTLVSAPPGFGKTTLLADWLGQSRLRAAWVSLDAGDNDPARFWTYITAALETVIPGVGESARALLCSPQPPPIEAILTDLLDELASQAENVVLVLDDYHTVKNPAIHRALTFFLQNMPEGLSLAIASREDPPLPLPALRAGRQLVEIRAPDLRFTPEEAAAFLHEVMGLDLTTEDVSALEVRTEGWIAGLQLVALSMQGVSDVAGFIKGFTGTNRYIFDYLMEEILQRQPPEVQAFLLQTSILDRMCAQLCDRLVGASTPSTSGQAMLERLDASNFFTIPLDQERRWYRYHHLFADFLRAEFEREAGPEALADLRRRAASWFREQGLVEDAVEHALAARDYNLAAGIIEQFAREIGEQGILITLLGWLRALPASALETHPRLYLEYTWALLATGQTEQVASLLQAVERIVGKPASALAGSAAADLPATVRSALVEVSIQRCALALNRLDLALALQCARDTQPHLSLAMEPPFHNGPDQLRAVANFTFGLANEMGGNIQAAAAMLAQAVAAGRTVGNVHIVTLALSHRAQIQVTQGRLHEAAATCREALRSEKERAASPFAGVVHAVLGNILVEWNELDAAERHLIEGIALGRQWSLWESLIEGTIGLVRIRKARGQMQAALALLDDAAQEASRHDIAVVQQAILPTLAVLRATLGDLEVASEWAEQIDLSAGSVVPHQREAEALAVARVLLAANRLPEAQRLLEQMLERSEAGGRMGQVIETGALLALALGAQGQHDGALFALRRALTLAEPGGYVRTFLDEGAPMARLLSGIDTKYAHRLLSVFPPLEPAGAPAIAAPGPPASGQEPPALLTEREVEVLRLVASGLSNQGIAERLVVSTNTVKTHVRSIYGKLDVQNRAQAILQARQLGLI